MAKAAKDDFDDVVKDDVAPSGKKDKLTLQNAFLDWKRRQVSKAQPKKGGGVGSAGSKAPSRGAKPRADDAVAKSLSGNSGGVAQAKPPAPFVADAYKPKQVRNLLDKVVDWYTHDPGLAADLQAWFCARAPQVPPIDMKRVGEGEYPVEAYSLFQEYTAKLEALVEAFLRDQGGCLADLHNLAKDWDNKASGGGGTSSGAGGGGGAYSDAWMFVTLFSACSTFLFFADCVKQAQEGDLRFDTTTGLNPKYAI